MKEKKYEFIDHLSDIGIKSYGQSIEELFENSALGMFSIMTDTANVGSGKKSEVTIEENDIMELEDLLISFLNDLLYRFEAEKLFFSKFNVLKVDRDKQKGKIEAELFGEKINLEKHKIKVAIKAVTYHMLNIEKKDKSWQATIIFDV